MTNNIIAEINNPTSTSFISSTFSQISQTSGFLPFSSSLENLTELIKQTKLNAEPQEEEEDEDEEEEEEGGGKKKKKLKKDEKGEGGKEKQEEIDMAIHPSGIVPTLQNIVSTVNLGCKLDLKKIALHARNAEYNQKRFAAVIMRIRDTKTTSLIFASGKMVCTGAKSEEASRLASRKYARIIQKLGFPAKFIDFKIQNIVGSCDVKFPIRLEGLAYDHSNYCSYEPELFPGLIYRMVQPKIVLLIFVSGKIVLTGAKVREEINEAFENIYPVLSSFRKL